MNQILVVSPILFPVLGILVNLVAGKRLGERFNGWVATMAVLASFVVSANLFLQVAGQGGAQGTGAINLGISWIKVATLDVPFGFLIDQLSLTMMLIVTGVGALIHIYSIGYMHGDPRFQRFFVYLNLFIASMLVLVMADSFLLMFVGWELVGLCSYLLIGFWFNNVKNAEAGRKAFVVNRIGDVGFVLAILLIFVTFGSVTYGDVFAKVATAGAPVLTAIALLLFVGAAGKSAQIPLFVWLPDAMAGPTPVSALIHAATMVTAGVYMMTRSHAIYALAPDAQTLVAVVGALTAFVAGSIALTQFDIKKVLAYSTISQLGFMVAAAGLGAYVAGVFHLFTHAFFKALLFLAAGSVIHGMEHLAKHSSHDTAPAHQTGDKEHGSKGEEHAPGAALNPQLPIDNRQSIDPQDMRNMGGLRAKMPVTFWVYVIGGLALAGLFPFAGFWSKDEIVGDALAHNPLVFILLAITAVFTAFYVGRQIVMVFFGKARTADAEHAAESGPLMTVPLIILAVFAAIAGFVNLPGVGAFANWLGPVVGEAEAAPFNIGIAALFTALALGALALAWVVYRNAFARADSPDPLEKAGGLFTFLKRAWFIDALYQVVVVRGFYTLSSFLARVFDVGGIDGVVNGIGALVQWTSSLFRRAQTGLVRSYGLIMLLGVVAVVAYFLLTGVIR